MASLYCRANPDGLPRLQYISMVMTDSSMTDSNKSLEMNALALKYLQDDQLTELAQFTVHKQRDSRHTETSLLRQVSLHIILNHSVKKTPTYVCQQVLQCFCCFARSGTAPESELGWPLIQTFYYFYLTRDGESVSGQFYPMSTDTSVCQNPSRKLLIMMFFCHTYILPRF